MQNPKLFQRTLLRIIRIYQATLSPDHGVVKILFPLGVCRFEETCSEYTYRAVQQRGAKGLVVGLKRLLHCHPFARNKNFEL